MSSSPPEFAVRPLRLEDAEAVHALTTAWEERFDCEMRFGVDDLREWWSHLDLDRDAWLWERDGVPAAYATLRALGRQFDSDGYVHPEFVGHGLGTAIVETIEARACARGAPKLGHGVIASDQAARSLLEAHGYRDVRHYYRMTIDMEGRRPAPTWPEGLEPRPVEPDHVRAWHAADEEAFEDERGHEPVSFEDFERRWLKSPRFDPSLWAAVWDGDEIAATLAAESKHVGGGWIAGLGVRRPWRKRGLGLALLLLSFAQFYDRGERRVALSVDSDSPTGATRLYERAGMRVGLEVILYEKDLRAA